MFRYSFKNKGSFFGLFFLVYIAIATFSCFGTLNTSLLKTYDTLINDYNMHNVVINELYDSNYSNVNQSRFRTWLNTQEKFEYRDFNAFDVSTESNSYKLIDYSNQYQIDMLDMFENKKETNWILNDIFHTDSLNQIVYQAQTKQTVLNDIIKCQTMAEFVKSDYLNQNQNWYILPSNTTNSKIWFGVYQDLNDDLVVDAFMLSNNQVVGYHSSVLILHKNDFKSFSKLTLNDYQNNFAWKYTPQSIYQTPQQKDLDKLTIKFENNDLFNNIPKNLNADDPINQKIINTLNIIDVNDEKEINNYLKKSLDENIHEVTFDDLKIVNQCPTSNDVLNVLLSNYPIVTNIKVLPSKQNYNPKVLISNQVDFLFTIKNNTKLSTYILKNVKKFNPLWARQNLFAFAANSTWSSKNGNYIKQELKNVEGFVQRNPIFDYAWFLDINNITNFQTTKLGQGLIASKVNHANDSYLLKGVNNWIKNTGLNANGVNLLINDFKVVFDLSGGTEVISGIFVDPTAYGAVVSYSWMEKNHKEIFPKSEWMKFLNKTSSQISLESALKDIDQKYIINISSTPYLILAAGITPDFMYPIISFENMVPNPQTQAIVYVGKTGYSRCFEAFQNNPREQFLLGKYKGNNLNSFVNNLNQKIVENDFMSWPQGTDAAYTYNSQDNKITPATLRVSFTYSLIKIINIISIGISVFISLIAVFIIVILIRQFVVKNRQTLGIMNANGYAKSKIIYALSTLCLIPAILGGLLGYLIGFFTNGFALNLFSAYWFLPVSTVSFNILFLVLSVLIPLILFIGITLLIGAISLRGSATTLLAKIQTIKVGIVARAVNHCITKTPIMTRFRSNIIFSTFYRLLVLSFMTSLVIVSADFMATSINSFDKTEKISSQETDYRFSIDLYSPTKEGGEFYGMTYDDLGKPFLSPNGYQSIENGAYKEIYKKNPYLREFPNIHYPSANDASNQNNLLDYLKYKVQVRELINFNMLTSNPWEFAQNMMPSNQANQAINGSKVINNMLMSDTRLLSLEMFLNKNETSGELSSNFPNCETYKVKPTTLNLKKDNSLNPPGLSLVNDDSIHSIKPIHIINFNNDKNLNYYNSLDLTIDINDLEKIIKTILNDSKSDITSNPSKFIKLSNQKILDIIHQFYTTNIPTAQQIFKLDLTNPIFKPEIVNYMHLSISEKNPNIVDIVFEDNNQPISGDLFLQPNAQNVLTYRNLFTGFYYEPHQKTDSEFNNSDELWNQAKNQNVNNWYLDPFSTMDNPIYYSAVNETMVPLLPLTLRSAYLNFVLNYFNDEFYTPNIFRITYGLIGLNGQKHRFDDEEYVYVNGLINYLNNKNITKPLTKYLSSNDIQLIGIKDKSQYIKLFDKNKKQINNLLENWNVNQTTIPVVINEYAAKTYNLKVNDIFRIEPQNTIDRFGKKLNSNYQSLISKKANNYNIKVVGISQSFHNSYAYIPIDAARKLIGLRVFENDHQTNLSPTLTSFNGIFSYSSSPYSLTNTVALYSPSGLYPGTSSWQPVNDTINNLITNAVKQSPENKNYKILNYALGGSDPGPNPNYVGYFQGELADQIAYLKKTNGITDDVIPESFVQEIAKKLANVYGTTTYQSMVMNAMAVDNANALYRSLSETVISLELTILTLIFVIALIVMMIMLWMILMDLMPLLALLATMGMSIWSNSLTFMCVLIPTWFISAIISGPIVYALLNLFSELIYTGIGILLLTSFNWWAYILIITVIGLIFGLVYLLGAKKLSNMNIANVIKR